MKTFKLNFLIFVFIVILILVSVISLKTLKNGRAVPDRNLITKSSVCPPFYLYDEDGNLINPVSGINVNKPYSPKQTCGKCHDYNKITEGFHFQQGKDEVASGKYADRYQWVSHPGNYGGNWCSPAPLYSYLSEKVNSSAKEMDMTSFTFITNGCGTCHPGGGSMEYDREGNRYDKKMLEMNFTAGGDNNFDGDYYKAFWNPSGVIEGDCGLCHLPEYNFKKRNENLLKYNFRWLATVGSGLASVEGSVKDTVDVVTKYNISKFGKDGKISMHLVREPRSETCLNCHSKPQWKKRGASFTASTDVHIAKGLKCVDCHVAGSMATDKRISGKEVHQFGKGDDPSGMVRNDLDNTLRTCTDCHITGYLNAPIAKHSWLPSFHLDEISCQTCHIPQRTVKAALVQVSDVYNPGTKISPPPKYVWTFYDQNMNYWNHYGELTMFTSKDHPSDPFVPQYARYKEQIFPVNPVHSAWPGIYTEGKKGLGQPKMKDIFEMWTAHRSNKAKYPALAIIKDDNADSIPEVNRPEEIDAFIHSVTLFLTDKGYNLDGRQVVWVNNDKMYLRGDHFEMLDKETWESSPYASVYKYSHDVFPAKAGLGAKGCVECHSMNSEMFYGQIVKYPFGDDANPVYESQFKRLAMSGFMVFLSAFREQFVKTIEIPVILFLLLILAVSAVFALNTSQKYFEFNPDYFWLIYFGLLAGFAVVYFKPDLNSYILPERIWFDKNHFPFSMFAFFTGLFVWLNLRKEGKEKTSIGMAMLFLLFMAALSGFFMLIKFDFINVIVKIAYTVFDVAIVFIGLLSIFCLIKSQTESLNPVNQ